MAEEALIIIFDKSNNTRSGETQIGTITIKVMIKDSKYDYNIKTSEEEREMIRQQEVLNADHYINEV